jgi:hypothetical protein
MKHTPSSLLGITVVVCLSVFLLTNLAAGQKYTAPSNPQIGSQNTVTADPPLSRPSTTPCVVPLFTGFTFADFSPKPFSYTPPSCPGSWAMVVLEADFSINAGRQFDRTANIWIGGVNVYFGTTAEPSHTVGRSWHIESDLTDYSPLFTAAQAGQVDLDNLVNGTYTSVLTGSAQLLFYPVPNGGAAPETADQVLAMSAGPTGGSVLLFSPSDTLSRTFSLPANVERVYLDVLAQSQSNDEFWYTCVPNDVAAELQSCGATAFRESEISIDGQPAGVAPVYPWIYTGGIDPYLWRPIPDIQTLNFAPYRVNLTPFAGILSDGNPHTVSLSVFNADSYFSTTASLLLYLDHGAAQVTGGLSADTIGSANPTVTENVSTDSSGNITGTVSVTSGRQFKVSGFANTSHGTVTTEVVQHIDFSNSQQFNITGDGNLYVQDITQSTKIGSLTTRTSAGQIQVTTRELQWPLTLNYSFVVNPDGSADQTTSIQQEYRQHEVDTGSGGPAYVSDLTVTDTPSDTLVFGSTTFPENQTSTQHFVFTDNRGACWDRMITASGGALTSVSDACEH